MADNRAVIIRVSLILLCAVVLWMVVKYYNAHKSVSRFTSNENEDEKEKGREKEKGKEEAYQPHGAHGSHGHHRNRMHEHYTDHDGGSAAVYGGGPNEVRPEAGLSYSMGGAPYTAVEAQKGEQHRAVACGDGGTAPASCNPQDQLRQSDLLPRDASNTLWAQVNPAGQGDLKDQNFLTAGYLIGIDTIGESLRNANRQLRSDPPNPQFAVGPWQNSTITPDTNRRPLEIGGQA